MTEASPTEFCGRIAQGAEGDSCLRPDLGRANTKDSSGIGITSHRQEKPGFLASRRKDARFALKRRCVDATLLF